MKKKYKLILIILICSLLAIVINFINIEDKVSVMAIGDGVAKGITSYNMEGISYNDYLKDYFLNKEKLKNYNTEFSKKDLTTKKLYNFLIKNIVGYNTKKPIKQLIAKSNLLIINIGMDELEKISLDKNNEREKIIDYLNYYDKFCGELREFYNKNIIIVGLYPTKDLNTNLIYSINNNLKQIASQNNTSFIDIMALSMNPKYYGDNNSYYMNNLGHEKIFELIKRTIMKNNFW